MKKIILISILIAIRNYGLFAQNEFIKLDQYFDTLDSHEKFMGNIAVSRNGELIYSRSVGYSNLTKKNKAIPNSKYRIGSISKTFTATLVMKAVELGKLSLSQTLNSYFPEINNAERITIEHLLSHRSGIHNFTNDSLYLTYHQKPKNKSELVEIIINGGSDFEPGLKSSYSNSNYVLLTFILEKCFSKTYSELVQTHIIKPLQLTNTYVGAEIGNRDNECLSYNRDSTWILSTETNMSIPMGAGNIVSNSADIVKFSDGLFSHELLTKTSLETMKIKKGDYGLGLFTVPFYDKIGYAHTGGIDGFSSIFCHFEEDNISYAMTSNAMNMNSNDINIAVLSATYGYDFNIPTFNNVDIETLMLYEGLYKSSKFPLDINIFIRSGELFAQATGQGAFPLTLIKGHKFEFTAADIQMTFEPKENKLTMIQRGLTVEFTKKK